MSDQSYTVDRNVYNLNESLVTFLDGEPWTEGGKIHLPVALRIHPWERERGEVFLEIDSQDESLADSSWNIILDRDVFVDGLLEVFPELRRRNDADV